MNKYLEKIAEELEKHEHELNHPYKKTTAKAFGRGILEGVGGGIAGGAATAILHRALGGSGAAGPIGATLGAMAGAVHGNHASLRNSLSNKKDFNVKDPNSAAWRALGRGLLYGTPASIVPVVGGPIGMHFGIKHSLQNTEEDGR